MATPSLNNDTSLQLRIDELAGHLRRYVAGELSHSALQEQVERHFRAFAEDSAWRASPYAAGERAYWCALWTVQHLADEEHWQDGLPQRDLSFLLPLLRDRRDLPEGWDGRRPSDANAI